MSNFKAKALQMPDLLDKGCTADITACPILNQICQDLHLLAQDFQSGSGGTAVLQFSPAHFYPPWASPISRLQPCLLIKMDTKLQIFRILTNTFQILLPPLTFEGTYAFSKPVYQDYFAIQVTRPLEIFQWISHEFWVVSIPTEYFMVWGFTVEMPLNCDQCNFSNIYKYSQLILIIQLELLCMSMYLKKNPKNNKNKKTPWWY